jgi:hypothetical protein
VTDNKKFRETIINSSLRKLRREQRVAILQDCIASSLTVREFAARQNIKYGTLTQWASREGISLINEKKKDLLESPPAPAPMESQESAIRKDKDVGNFFPFIEVTNDTAAMSRSSAPPVSFCQNHGNSTLHRNIQPPPRPKDSPLPCSIELRLPTGLILKVEQIPLHDFLPQAVEFARALA